MIFLFFFYSVNICNMTLALLKGIWHEYTIYSPFCSSWKYNLFSFSPLPNSLANKFRYSFKQQMNILYLCLSYIGMKNDTSPFVVPLKDYI